MTAPHLGLADSDLVPPVGPLVLNTDDAGLLLGVSGRTVQRCWRRGLLPGWHTPSGVRFLPRDVLALIRDRDDRGLDALFAAADYEALASRVRSAS